MVEYQDDFIGGQLRRLQQSGQMEGNPYHGKPLELDAYFKAPKATRAINRFLADAGFRPPKLEALAQLREKEQEYARNPTQECRDEMVAARLRYDVLR